jgi:hypothetical protein
MNYWPFEVGDQVKNITGEVGTVKAANWGSVVIHWPNTFKSMRYVNGHSVWYTYSEIKKYGIQKAN